MFSSLFESGGIRRLPFILSMAAMFLLGLGYLFLYVSLQSKGYWSNHRVDKLFYILFGLIQLYFIIGFIFARITDMDISDKSKLWSARIYFMVSVVFILGSNIGDEYTKFILIVWGIITFLAFLFLCLKKGKDITQEKNYSVSFHQVKIRIDSSVKVSFKEGKEQEITIIID